MPISYFSISYELPFKPHFLDHVDFFSAAFEKAAPEPFNSNIVFLPHGKQHSSVLWCWEVMLLAVTGASVYCTPFSMQPCRCLQKCHTGGCLHHDHHRLWLGRCTVRCPCGEILCQSKHGLPETATGIWKTWCWSGKWTTKTICERQLQVRSWATSHYFVVCVVYMTPHFCFEGMAS